MGKLCLHSIKLLFCIATCTLLCSQIVNAQLLNKVVEAKILVEESSEFYTLKATTTNKTITDRNNLRFEFSSFKKDPLGNTIKDTDEGLFVLAASEKKILADKTINASEEARVIIVLSIYNDEGKPIGQDRIVFNDTPPDEAQKATLANEQQKQQATQSKSQDMAAPQDGFILDGLVIENSLTKMGRDFYTLFYSIYYNSGVKSQKNIIIDEVPGRTRNTRITVKVEDQLVWQFISNPRWDYLKQQAEYAFRRVLGMLQQLQRTQETITHY